MRVNKKFVIFVLTLVVLGGGYFFRNSYLHYFSGVPRVEKPVGDFLKNVETVAKEIFTPPPLFVDTGKGTVMTFLSRDEVWKWTNLKRIENGLQPLALNVQLNFAATGKANDMLENQYFAHISSAGVGVDFWVKDAGYEYVVIGENLALGDFEDDEALVEAWMDSPGHRENILNPRYKEIGIAVLRGVFEGHDTWFAVQVFGTSLSVCPEPNNALSFKIETYKQSISTHQSTIELLRSQIEDKKLRRQADKNDYIKLIEEYNALVAQYNSLAKELEGMIDGYNIQVRNFNNCVLDM